MKKLFGLLLALLLVFPGGAFLSGCDNGRLFIISQEFIGILWNVDYRTFSPDPNTEFARAYYDSDYLADYLVDIDDSAGVSNVALEKLVAHVKSTEDLGTSKEVLGEVSYTIQKVRAVIAVDNFEPEDPSMSFFEEGQEYTLIFSLFFRREGSSMKLSSYGFEPEGEAFLPAGEKQRLTEEQRAQISLICQQYLSLRYEMDAATFEPAKRLMLYQALCAQTFLDRDGIDEAFLNSFGEELVQYHVSVTLLDSSITVGEQKESYYDGETSGFYYWAELSYVFGTHADEAYFKLHDIGETQRVREKLYFTPDGSRFLISSAEYLSS